MNIRIAVNGYGSMGREVEKIAETEGCKLVEIFDIDQPARAETQYDFDIVIDFTRPDAVVENVELFSSMGKNIVLGTTGWYDKKDEIEKIIKKQGNGLIWGSNFSIGMQMLFRIVRKAAALMDKVDGYDIMLHEMHHMRKKDSPSGSGISLANIILDEVSRKKGIFSETAHEQINPNKLHLSSTRGGEIHGTHTVYLDSLSDTIELTHRAKNRSGFAKGALTAARWIKGKTGFYKFDDILDELWQS